MDAYFYNQSTQLTYLTNQRKLTIYRLIPGVSEMHHISDMIGRFYKYEGLNRPFYPKYGIAKPKNRPPF